MTSRPDRPTLTTAGLRAAAAGLPWTQIEVAPVTGSTNTDLLARAERGAPEGLVLAVDEQTAGRGRLGRTWVSPPGASVSVSVLLRPRIPHDRLGWLPLLAGLAVAAAIGEVAGLAPVLKWPNDVLVDSGRLGKVAGILVERSGEAAVLGFGINTAMEADELPVPEASSLLLAGAAAVDPDALVAACLDHLHRRYAQLVTSGDPERSGLAAEYRQRCATLGRAIEVALPTGGPLVGTALRIDDAGRLVLQAEGREHVVAAGDVRHVR